MQRRNQRKKRFFIDELEKQRAHKQEGEPLSTSELDDSAGANKMPDPKASSFGALEPYVGADKVAEYIDEDVVTVGKLTRQGVLTAYPLSGRQRCRYKYKLSEVDRDIALRRRERNQRIDRT